MACTGEGCGAVQRTVVVVDDETGWNFTMSSGSDWDEIFHQGHNYFDVKFCNATVPGAEIPKITKVSFGFKVLGSNQVDESQRFLGDERDQCTPLFIDGKCYGCCGMPHSALLIDMTPSAIWLGYEGLFWVFLVLFCVFVGGPILIAVIFIIFIAALSALESSPPQVFVAGYPRVEPPQELAEIQMVTLQTEAATQTVRHGYSVE